MILAKLKEATRAQHEGLEGSVDVMSRMFALEDYKTLLTKFYRFYAAIEPELEKLVWSDVGYDFEERRKLPKLEEDLMNLGLDLVEIKSAAPFSQIPNVDDFARAFGTLYVLEGATLGGQIIKRHLKEHLGLTPENGGSFFNGYGEQTGMMWKSFGTVITAFAENGDHDDAIVETAKETFDSFRKCFEQSVTA